jgi:hypothetical protein
VQALIEGRIGRLPIEQDALAVHERLNLGFARVLHDALT